MLRNPSVFAPAGYRWGDMLRNPDGCPRFLTKTPLFLRLFGWVSAGMAHFLTNFTAKISRIFDGVVGGYAPDYPRNRLRISENRCFNVFNVF